MVIIFGIALTTNIDWSRHRVEAMLSTALHRRLNVGHLRWTFGVHGLSLESNTVRICEADGRPFIDGAHSEVGIALWPLLSGKLKIKSISLNSPEIWAVRTSSGLWNFDDLLKASVDLQSFQVNNGTVHLKDASLKASGDCFTDITLHKFKISLAQPKPYTNRPFILGFVTQHQGHTPELELNATEFCKDQDWRANKCKIKLSAKNFSIDDIKLFANIFNININDLIAQLETRQVSVLFALDGSSEGILDKHWKGKLHLSATNLSLKDNQLGLVTIPYIESTLRLKSLDHVLSLSNSTFSMPPCKIEGRIEGKIADWTSLQDTAYSGNVVALIEDLSALSKLLPQAANADNPKLKYLVGARGRALIDTTITNDREGLKFASRLRASHVSLKGINDLIEQSHFPVLSLLSLNEASQMSGDVFLDSNDLVECKDCIVDNDGKNYKLNGYVNLREKKSRLEFILKDFNLKALSEAIGRSKTARIAAATFVRLPTKSTIELAGKATVKGLIEQINDTFSVKSECVLKDAKIAISAPKLSFEHLNGSVKAETNQFVLNHLASRIDQGKLEISGSLPTNNVGPLDLHLQASNFDLGYLSSLLELFRIDTPIFANHQLTGRVKELSLDLGGTPKRTSLSIYAQPDQLSYAPLGLAEPLKVSSGVITYKNDRLELNEVSIVMHGGPILASIAIDDIFSKARLEKLKFKTQGTDLKDINYYLASPVSPTVLKSIYLGFINGRKISCMHGKVYGDMSCTISDGKPHIDGLIGFINAGAKIGESKQPIEHGSGVLVATGNQLLLHGLNGSIHDSHVELDGRINDYQNPNPRWWGELRANINPLELNQWLPFLGGGELINNRFRVTSASPLELTAKLNGHSGCTSGIFALAADPEDRLTLTGPFGLLHQPPGERLLFDGIVKIDPHLIQVSDAHLTIGTSTLKGEGCIRRPSKVSNSQGKSPTGDLELAMQVHSSDNVSLKSVLGLLDPSLADDQASGKIKGFLSLNGKLSEPAISSEISFDRACLPKHNLYNLTGTLTTINSQRPLGENKGIKASLKAKSGSLGKLNFSDLTAEADWIVANNNLKAPKIVLTNCTAIVAGGQLSLEGCMDLSEGNRSIKASVKDAEASTLIEELADVKGELTGLIDVNLSAHTSGDTSAELLANINGKGSVTVRKGTLSRIGTLQTRINQGNFVHQGLFGFNVNNLVQSVAPVRTGVFRKLETSFHVASGHLSVDTLNYDGDDMQLWASGQANLRLHTIELQIEGTIPRVANSAISRPFGGLSREITVQKMMDSVTLHKLEKLPSLPLLGDIASDKPRSFMFKVLAPYDQPKLISQSIEKSFRWHQGKFSQAANTAPAVSPYGPL